MANIDTKKEFLKLRQEYIVNRFSHHLNPEQVEAVVTTEGPLLILAGAGSGKTTVVVNRIMNLLEFGNAYSSEWLRRDPTEEDCDLLRNAVKSGTPYPQEIRDLMYAGFIRPWNILAITFTNKAAGELKERIRNGVEATLEGVDPNEVFASTFHSMCVRFLRRDADLLGYPKSFTIYDDDDSQRVMKEIYKTFDIDDKLLPVRTCLGRISRLKDKLVDDKSYADQIDNERDRTMARLYREYQTRLRKAGAMDFDDLIFNTVKLLEDNKEVREHYHDRFRYIMVDEYQDTSVAQFRLCQLLTNDNKNICVVGDDDQSIYRFRGATIENILSFEDHFPGAKVVRLERNYRSTGAILDAANAVIAHNKGRKGKNLWTDKPNEPPLTVYCAMDEQDEAHFVVGQILKHKQEGVPLKNNAVLYRMRAQSNALENHLRRAAIPYKIVGGTRFYDRTEIKDIISYMELVANRDDDLRLKRIINKPSRKIGDTTINAIQDIAQGLGVSMFEVCMNAGDYPMLSRAAKSIKGFCDVYENLAEYENDIYELVEHIISDTGYRQMLEADGEEGMARLQNVEELLSNVRNYIDETEEPTLNGFLEDVALISDIDSYDPNEDACVLMTFHSAKGLEFDYVYMVGMEESIFPSEQSKYTTEDIEEERRLAYVGITRAKKELVMTRTESRLLFGSTRRNSASRFLGEIPQELVTDKTPERKRNSYQDQIEKLRQNSRNQYNRRQRPQKSYFTGSTLNDIKPKYQKSDEKYAPGDMVEHKVFGRGKILDSVPMGGDTLLTIDFEKVGIKKAMANYAPLTKL